MNTTQMRLHLESIKANLNGEIKPPRIAKVDFAELVKVVEALVDAVAVLAP